MLQDLPDRSRNNCRGRRGLDLDRSTSTTTTTTTSGACPTQASIASPAAIESVGAAVDIICETSATTGAGTGAVAVGGRYPRDEPMLVSRAAPLGVFVIGRADFGAGPFAC